MHGPIAQMVERTPDKREVPGSSPGRPTIIKGQRSEARDQRSDLEDRDQIL